MNARDWKHLLRRQRVAVSGLLCIGLLTVAWGADELLAERNRLVARLDRLEALNAAARAKKDRFQPLEAARRESAAAYSGVAGRMVPAETEETGVAGEKFGQSLKGWYGSAGVTTAAILSVERKEEGGIAYYRAEIEAPMRIEQFAQLMQNKRTAPLALRLEQATVEANDPHRPTGLRTRMKWVAMQALPVPIPEAGTSGKPDKNNAKGKPAKADTATHPDKPAASRVLERGRSEPAMKLPEEKRK